MLKINISKKQKITLGITFFFIVLVFSFYAVMGGFSPVKIEIKDNLSYSIKGEWYSGSENDSLKFIYAKYDSISRISKNPLVSYHTQRSSPKNRSTINVFIGNLSNDSTKTYSDQTVEIVKFDKVVSAKKAANSIFTTLEYSIFEYAEVHKLFLDSVNVLQIYGIDQMEIIIPVLK